MLDKKNRVRVLGGEFLAINDWQRENRYTGTYLLKKDTEKAREVLEKWK